MSPSEKMRVVLADPPWKFYGARHSGVKCPYKTMSTRDIKKLGVRELVGDEGVIFMWTTDTHLAQALKVMAAWGFVYKTIAFVWVKTTKRMVPVRRNGFYTRKSCEICLLGTRGAGACKMIDFKPKQLVVAPAREHSRKPDEVGLRIKAMFPQCKRYELFARQKVDGWQVWGDEVSCDFEI